jgi:hypothetical protein
VSQSESAPDHTAIAKEISHFVWPSAGREVEVFGFAPEHQVSHSATDEVGRVAVPIKTPNDLGGVGIEQSARDRVRVDDRFGRLCIESAPIVSPTKVGI